jgi:hypothetical protein
MTLAEWFEMRDKDKPKPKFFYGDRVFSRYLDVPMIGMVVRENVEEKLVLIHSDLPIKIKDDIRHVVWTPVKMTSKLKELS